MVTAQEEKVQLVDIAIPLPIQDPYTYRVPPQWAGGIRVGCRVRIPFRNRTIIGYVVATDSERIVDQPKDILEVLDSEPILSEHLLRLARWISEHYFSSWGEAISNMIPKMLKTKSKSEVTETILRDTANTLQPNEEQEKAFSRINARIREKQFCELYVFGVTAGGKTELYIRAIKEVLKSGRSAVCLVPEIALTEQLKLFFEHHFPDALEILHSKLSNKDRFEAWLRIRSGEKRVILGVRSAVFAPAKNLGLLILDEEQESSYKQDQSPRYHAREVAQWRARDLNVMFLMGTATPTLETMHRAREGEVELLELSKRVDGRAMPEVNIIDLKRASEISKKFVIISTRLQNAIQEALDERSGILLMLNRRGFSTHVQCTQCGEVLYCPHCAVSLTFHQAEGEALCHYCNFHKEIPKLCGKCRSPILKFSGIGTEKVESEVARLFPGARIARLDADAARKRGSHELILKQFRSHGVDILVGTQMIAKGFDFQHVSLVGIINADTGLLLPDFRSSERTFQLLTQMAGRTGRGKGKGTVLIQTYSPNHYSIQFASQHNYMGFFREEIERRRQLKYPPFAKLINVMLRGKKEIFVWEQAQQFRQLLQEGIGTEQIEILGPAPLPLYRLRGQFRWHVMLRATKLEEMAKPVRAALGRLRRKTGVYLAVDVEPVTIL